jgi:ankyrin repeat domain-containing protein 50
MTTAPSILCSGANVKHVDGDGWSVLKRAARGSHTEIVKLLLEHGADPDSPDEEGWTALMNAGVQGDVDLVNVLIAAGANVDHQVRVSFA